VEERCLENPLCLQKIMRPNWFLNDIFNYKKLLLVGPNCYCSKNKDNHLRTNLMLMIFCIPIWGVYMKSQAKLYSHKTLMDSSKLHDQTKTRIPLGPSTITSQCFLLFCFSIQDVYRTQLLGFFLVSLI
jgi:hypothetical protein